MPIVLLIRHGENDYVKTGRIAGRQPGVHLNDTGRQQAQSLAEHLARAPIKAIYSSPLERAIETAEPIAAALKLPVIQREGLIESDCGEWQDQALKDLTKLKIWKAVQNTPSLVRIPGGESFLEMQVRIQTEIEALCALHKPKETFICISHADPIKLAVAYFIGMPLDLFQRLFIAPASITALHIGPRGALLLALNSNFSFALPKA